MPHPPVRPRLGELLLERGVINPQQLRTALEHQRQSGQRLGRALLERQLCDPEALWSALSQQQGLPFVHLDGERLDSVPRSLLSQPLAERYGALPLRYEGSRQEVVVVALSAPASDEALEAVSRHCGRPVQPVLASDEALAKAFQRLFPEPEPDATQPSVPAARSTSNPSRPLEQQVLALCRKGSGLVTTAFRLLTKRTQVDLLSFSTCRWKAKVPRSILVHGWPQAAAAGMTVLLASEGWAATHAAHVDELFAATEEDLILLPLDEAEKLHANHRPLRARLVLSSVTPEEDARRARALNALALLREPLDAEVVMRAVRATVDLSKAG